MRRCVRRAVSAGALSVCLLGAGPDCVRAAPRDLVGFLRKHIQFKDGDLATMERGEVVTRLLPTGDKKEIAAFGVVRVRAAKEEFLRKLRDVVGLRSGPTVPEIGTFGNPPRLEDLRGLTLDPADLEALRECRPGDCDVKLPAALMERVHREVDWAAPDAARRATDLAKQMLLDYVRAYGAGGNAAMGAYHDRSHPQDMAFEFRAILSQSPYLFEYVPELHAYLEGFPQATLSNAEDFIYWSKEKFGLKPVVSLTHVTLYSRPRGSETDVFVAAKRLYSSHYFQAALDLVALVDEGAGQPSFYLLNLNRSRIDPPKGPLAGVLLRKIAGRVEGALRDNLRRTKARVEG